MISFGRCEAVFASLVDSLDSFRNGVILDDDAEVLAGIADPLLNGRHAGVVQVDAIDALTGRGNWPKDRRLLIAAAVRAGAGPIVAGRVSLPGGGEFIPCSLQGVHFVVSLLEP